MRPTERVVLWSAPHDLATLLLAAFAARGDCAVWDEPFRAPWLDATGTPEPGREATLAAHETDPDRVANAARGPAPGGWPLFVQKHRAHHMVWPMPRAWMRSCRHVFVLRHPARVVAEAARVRPDLGPGDLGFDRLEELFDEVAGWSGEAPPVIDGEALPADPEGALRPLCDRLGIAFTPRMLRWPAGPKPFDGAWAPWDYAAVHRAAGLRAAEGPPPPLGGRYAAWAEAGTAGHERLLRFA